MKKKNRQINNYPALQSHLSFRQTPELLQSLLFEHPSVNRKNVDNTIINFITLILLLILLTIGNIVLLTFYFLLPLFAVICH